MLGRLSRRLLKGLEFNYAGSVTAGSGVLPVQRANLLISDAAAVAALCMHKENLRCSATRAKDRGVRTT